MSNILDYLDWRGDITLSYDPFNEVDNGILANLAYIDFEGLVSSGFDEGISLEKFAVAFFEKNGTAKLESGDHFSVLLSKSAKSRRFKNIVLKGFKSEINEEKQFQFAAISFYLEDGTVYIAYRGTDSSTAGWREDINMSFTKRTPGQLMAAGYINKNFQEGKYKLRLGGHSKGGNFAVSAGLYCAPWLRDDILEIYSNDGPGFLKEVISSPEYQELLPRIKSIIPNGSVVGLLLDSYSQHIVIESCNTGIEQHHLSSWQVLGNSFVRAPGLTKGSIFLNATMDNWLEGLADEEKAAFAEALFDILSSGDANLGEKLKKGELSTYRALLVAAKDLPPDKQTAMLSALKRLAISGKDVALGKVARSEPSTELQE